MRLCTRCGTSEYGMEQRMVASMSDADVVVVTEKMKSVTDIFVDSSGSGNCGLTL